MITLIIIFGIVGYCIIGGITSYIVSYQDPADFSWNDEFGLIYCLFWFVVLPYYIGLSMAQKFFNKKERKNGN